MNYELSQVPRSLTLHHRYADALLGAVAIAQNEVGIGNVGGSVGITALHLHALDAAPAQQMAQMLGLLDGDRTDQNGLSLFMAGSDLIDHGVDGIHLYTMNDPNVALRVHEAISDLLPQAEK